MVAVSTGYEVMGRQMSVSRDGVKTTSRMFEVVTDTTGSMPEVYTAFLAWATSNGVGDAHPNDSDLFFDNIRLADGDTSNRHFKFEINYSSFKDLSPNPLLEPARLSFSTEFYQVPVFVDRNNQALVTSAGEYPEGLFEDAVQLNLTFSKNVVQIPGWFLTSIGAVNNQPWTVRGLTFAAELCRLSSANASDELTRNGYLFYKLNFTTSYRLKGWTTDYMDRGYYRKGTGVETDRVKIHLSDGSVPSSPVPLDGNGQVLVDPKPSNIVIFNKKTKPAFNFNTLPTT